jgi:chromosome segregation ATPase
MKPLNNKERNKAFFKVTGLFLIAFVIALILGFTTMNMGSVSEKSSRIELERLKEHLKFQEEIFAPNVGEATSMISKIPNYETEGENLEVLNQDIGAVLSQTKNQVVEDESWETKMYQDVIKTLSDLQLAYNSKLDLMEEMGDSDETSQKLQECIAERNQLQTQVNMLQSSGGGGGGDTEQLQKELKDAQNKLRQCNLENRALKQEIEKIRNR